MKLKKNYKSWLWLKWRKCKNIHKFLPATT